MIAGVGGRGSVAMEISHTIPFELFGGRKGNLVPNELVQLFKEFGGTKADFDFDGPDNKQRLPRDVIPEGSAAHFRSHPGMTKVVDERMSQIVRDFERTHGPTLQAARAGDPAAKTTMKNLIAGKLRETVTELQFKSTNFMDDAASSGNRMLFNRRDLAYLKTTQTWANATPAERVRALAKPTDLIAKHNRAVLSAGLSAERQLEMKVLKDLGGGVLAHTDGTATSRNAIRALISEARAVGVNLADAAVDTKAFVHSLEDRFDNAVRSLTTQIDNVAAQIATAPEHLKPQLLAQKAALESDRLAAYAAQTIGTGESRFSMNTVRRVVYDTMTRGRMGRIALESVEFLAKRILPKFIPGLNIVSTAYDIGSGLVALHGFAMTHSTTYLDFYASVYSFFTGKQFDKSAYIQDSQGNTALMIEQDGMQTIVVVGTRIGPGSQPETSIYSWSRPAITGEGAPGKPQIVEILGTLENTELPENPFSGGGGGGGGYRGWSASRNGDGSVDVQTLDETPVAEGEYENGVLLQHRSEVRVNGAGMIGEPATDMDFVIDLPATEEQPRRRQTGSFEANMTALGGILGSQLASALRIENPWAAFAVNTTLSALGANLGRALASDTYSLTEAFDDLPDSIKSAGVGAVSSFVFGQLVDELGLEGTLGGAVSSLGGAAIAQIATNLQQLSAGFTTFTNAAGEVSQLTWSSGVGMAMASAAGAFIGAWLASKVIQFDTIEGQIGSALGTAVGAFAGAKIGATYGSWGGPIGALIGAFVGFIFGGLLGSLFSSTPRSGADVSWDQGKRQFTVSGAWARGGAKSSAAVALTAGAADVLNAILQRTGSQLVDGHQVRAGSYGTHGKNFVYRTTNPETGKSVNLVKLHQVEHVIRYGTLYAVADLIPRLAGGNVFAKRALAATLARANIDTTTLPATAPNPITGLFQAVELSRKFDVNALLGNLTLALEYSAFWEQQDVARFLMTTEPDSAMSLTWAATIASAIDLGLHKRGATDWTGGWTVFMDEATDGMINGQAFAPANLDFALGGEYDERMFGFFDAEGNSLGVLGDTIDSKAKDSIGGTDAGESIIINGATIANAGGLTINDAAGSGSFTIRVAATVNAQGGNDTVVAGDLGNDVFGGEGNDTLVGGQLDDWLFGDEGNDRLFAGAANYQFADGDIPAMVAAVDTVSNGDLLDGGDGDDFVYGSRGSDWLRGGEGADVIVGGAGGDIIDGGGGNDVGPAGEARLFGGAGTDQYVFGYGSGVDAVFDESDSDYTLVYAQDTVYARLQQIQNGTLARNWAGGGFYEVDGSVKGGEDAISFGLGIGMRDLVLQRSGNDLRIGLTYTDPDSGAKLDIGDELIIKDWFETTRRIEWLRFADGEAVRIGDVTSFIVGTAASDIIIGSSEADFMYGGAGDDAMYGLAGNDFGFGGAGNDLVAGDDDNDWVAGGLGNDKVIGGAGNDTVFGDSGNDEVFGGAGSDIVVGGLGDDVVVGGSGDDIFRFQRGDGRDVLLDSYVNNWDVVFANNTYTNGYVLDQATGRITKDGIVYFDGSQWIGGQYDFDYPTQTLRRHLGAVNGVLAANSGADYLEFGVGIDIQDLMLRRTSNDLEIAVSQDGDGTSFDGVADRLTLRDWYSTGNSIENFVFVSTGRHALTGWTLNGGSDSGETLTGGSGIDWITGNGGDDTIVGNAGNDILSGNAGADLVRGNGGADILYGGAGDDVLDGGVGADVLVGGTGIDIASYVNAGTANRNMRAFLNAPLTNTFEGAGDSYVSIEGLEGTAGADVLGGDDGENILRGAAGSDSLFGGAGDDIYEINLGHGADVIDDRPFTTEVIVDSQGNVNTALFSVVWDNTGYEDDGLGTVTYYYELVINNIRTGELVYRWADFSFPYSMTTPPSAYDWPSDGWMIDDRVTTGNGAQVVREVFSADENGGEDTLEFGADIALSDLTIQRLNGNADLQITYRSGHSVTIRGQNAANSAVELLQLADGLTVNLSRLVLAGETASSDDDFLAGNASGNTLDGLAGDDVLSGAGGSDTLRGGEGDDVLEGGVGSDTLDGGTDSVSAGLALTAEEGSGAYGDTIRYVRSNAAVTIDLASRTASGGHAAGDVIVAASGVSTIENVVGSSGYHDVLRGDSRANRLAGLGGDDVLDGRAGDDLLVGGAGHDQLLGGDGNDNLSGEDGNDTVEGGAGVDLLAGGAGDDIMRGDAGNDVISGGEGIDQIFGGADDDRIGGEAGNDVLSGDAGNDQLAGGEGDDILNGGDGDDELVGETGNDTLRGDLGNDTYWFGSASGSDTIVDASGANHIALGDGIRREQVWLTRSGNDLVIRVIGAPSVVTLQDYYASTNPTRVREIALGSGDSLFLAHAEPLIAAMSGVGSLPSAMPADILDLLTGYWHANGKPKPVVSEIVNIDNSMGVVVSGNVNAVDHDDNIVSYQLQSTGTRGSVALNQSTGAWTYTPQNNPSGEDVFGILVTDADGQTALQTIRVILPADPANITIITQVQVVSPQAPLTKPTLDSGSWGVLIAASLTDNDTSEIIDLRVTGVPAGITFNTGTDLGNGVWSFGNGPWPTEIRGPANWSQDLALSVTATAREIATGWTLTSDPVPLNIEINARPTDITASALAFDENTAAGTALATLAALDADGGDTATYSLLNNAGGRFALSSTGQLTAGSTALNFESASSHVIRVQVTDSGGLTYARDLTVTVRNVNEAPTVTNQSLSTNEDAQLSGSVVAADPDGNISSYAIAVNATRGVVSLNATTGAWTYTPNANLYGADSFQVRVTDAGGLSTVQTVNVNVVSQNDAPTNIALTGSPATVAENDRPITGTVASAVVLGTLSATDIDAPDAGDFATHVFSVSDSRFEIVNGNVLRLRAGAVVDFEAGSSISVNVTVRDRNGQASGLTFTRQFTFTVADQDDYFYGTASGETITGTAGRNLIYGQGGNDTLTGAGANDLLDGGEGADTLNGLGGNDILTGGLGDDILDGGAGIDTLGGGDGNDTLRGADGNDTLNGEAGLDLLQGGAGDDLLDGGADNDRLEGGDASDRLVGGTGDDSLVGGAGADRFLGGAGTDTVSYETATAGITVDVTTTTGSAGDATGDVFEDSIERIVGSGFADTIRGSAANETLEGGAGNDTIYGGAGNDVLVGGDGNDYLDAESGNDTLNGGAGSDILIGGDDSDTYLMDINSGADEIRNFDPSGLDIDVVGYQGIERNQLWFERSGNDLIVTVVGTTVRTTITNWYGTTTASERANYKIDFFLASGNVTNTINAEGLINLMAGYTRPTTQAQYDALHANSTFETAWQTAWNLNTAPSMPGISAQSVNEDGTLTLTVQITDDITPVNGLTVTAQAVRVDDNSVEDLRIVNAPTIGSAAANGDRSLTVTTKPNASGQVAIRVRAVDAGGLVTERVFLLTVNAVADAPSFTVLQAVNPTAPLTKPTLDSGAWSLNVQVALADTDGSEVLDEIRISGVPAGITFSAGTDLTGGVWRLTPAQLANLQVRGPATWSQDLSLSMTATARETATGATRTSTAVPFNIVINARPTDISAPTLSFNENTAANTVLTTLTRADADAGDTATFTLVDNAGGRFALDTNGTLRAGSTALNHESASSHLITVRVTDSGGLSYDETLTVNVTNVNEAPTNISLSASQVFENDPVGTTVGTLSRSDVDAGDTATYTLVTNPGNLFRISGTSLQTNAALDYEAGTSYTVRVRITDGGGLTYERDFTISVLNRNEAPTAISLSASSVYENDAAGTTIGTLGRTDADAGDTATYTLVTNPGNQFRITGNTLQTNAALNYEAGSSHVVRVRVTDAGGLTYERDFTISVLNRNEAPTDITAPALSINENTGANVNIGQLAAVDPDSGETFTFVRLPSYGAGLPGYSPNEEFFDVTSSGMLYTTNNPLNYERRTSWNVQIRVSDSAGNTYIETLTVNVGNVNEAPVFSPASQTYDTIEDVGRGGSSIATDPEGNISSYSLHLAPTRGTVSVNSSGGWQYTPNAHVSGTDSFQVRVTDTGGLIAVQTVTINVAPVNDAPTFGTQAMSVIESAPAANQTLVGTLSSSDLEGNAVTYSVLSGLDSAAFNDKFTLTAATGQIWVQRQLDYETKTRYDVMIRATDSLGASTDAVVTVNIAPFEEDPVLSFAAKPIGSPNPLNYAGRATVSNLDAGETATIQIISADQYCRTVNANYGTTEWEWWQYTNATLDASGNLYVNLTYWRSDYYYDPIGTLYDEWTTQARVVLQARDSSNSPSNYITVNFFTYYSQVAPVGLDLDGDGLELVKLDESSVSFALGNDGANVRTGWVAADDGFLALDRNQDGVIAERNEISFIDDLAGATSDLEGLVAFDTDADGHLDAGDARFEAFLVWQDRNQDGVSQSDELSSLADRGIESINLARTLTGDTPRTQADNFVSAVSEYLRTDGTTGEVGDVTFAVVEQQVDVSDELPADLADSLAVEEADVEALPDANEGVQVEVDLDTGIGEIDRSAKDPTPAPEPQELLEADDPRAMPGKLPAQPSVDGSHRRNSRWAGANADASSVDRFKRHARNIPSVDQLDASDDWELEGARPAAGAGAGGALHASLDTVARRRLQMIDAMASFSTEKSSMLELQPQRTVDGRTLALLTAVQGVRDYVP